MLGYKSKQGFSIFRCRVKRGGHKKMVAKGIVYGRTEKARMLGYKSKQGFSIS